MRGDGGIRRRGKGSDEIEDDGFLGRGEMAVPNEIDGNVAGEKMAAMVFERE